MKLAHVKEPPLLNPPDGNACPWKEITQEDVTSMRACLRGFAQGGKLDELTFLAAGMKALGLDVSSEAKEYGHLMKLELSKLKDRGDWWDYAIQAGCMKKGGVDISKELKDSEFSLMRDLRTCSPRNFVLMASKMKWLGFDVAEEIKIGSGQAVEEMRSLAKANAEDFLPLAVDAEKIGLDAASIAKEHEKQLRERLGVWAKAGNWPTFTHYAAKMRLIGIRVKDETAAHRGDILGSLLEFRKEGNWQEFANHACKMVELGLLSPAEKGGQQLPPLKRIGGGS